MHPKQREQRPKELQNAGSVWIADGVRHEMLPAFVDDVGSSSEEMADLKDRGLPSQFVPPPRSPPPVDRDVQNALARCRAIQENDKHQSQAASIDLFHESAAIMLGRMKAIQENDKQQSQAVSADLFHESAAIMSGTMKSKHLVADKEECLSTSEDGDLERILPQEVVDLHQPFGMQGFMTMEEKIEDLKAWEERANHEEDMWRVQLKIKARTRAGEREREEAESQAFLNGFKELQIHEGGTMAHAEHLIRRPRLKPRQPMLLDDEGDDHHLRKARMKPNPRSRNSSPQDGRTRNRNRSDCPAWVIKTSSWPEQMDAPRSSSQADRNFRHFHMAKHMADRRIDFSQRAEQRNMRAKARAKSAEKRRRCEKEEEMVKRLQERSTFTPRTNANSKKIIARTQRLMQEKEAGGDSVALELRGAVTGAQHDSEARRISASARLRMYWEDELEAQATQDWRL